MPPKARSARSLVAALAFQLGLALPAGAATFIVFHSPSNNGEAPGKPSVAAFAIPVGANANVQVYLENYDPLGPGSADPAAVCVSATSNHVCGWRVTFIASGMRINSVATPALPGDPIESNLASGGSRLDVTGGSANGETGPVRIGTLQVTALEEGGTLVAQPSFLDAAGVLQTPSQRVVAVTLDTCGNAVLNTPPEQCDDGNRVNGDGCFRSCRLERSFTLLGTAQGGSVQIPLAERSTPLAISTIPGEPAAALAGRVAGVMNEDPPLVAAHRSAENVSSGTVATDATLGSVSSSDAGITIPEPSVELQLFAGVALLRWLGRRRLGASRRRARASTAASG